MQKLEKLSLAPGHILVSFEEVPEKIGAYVSPSKGGRTPMGIVVKHGPPDPRHGPAPQPVGTRVVLPPSAGRKFKDAKTGVDYAVLQHTSIVIWNVPDDAVLVDRL